VPTLQETLQIYREGGLYGLACEGLCFVDGSLGGLELDDNVAGQLLIVIPGGKFILILLLNLH
jgi:hypothetical protein